MEERGRERAVNTVIVLGVIVGGFVFYRYYIQPNTPSASAPEDSPKTFLSEETPIPSGGGIIMPGGEVIYPTGGWKTNLLTGAQYQVVSNPIKSSPNECLIVGKYSESNKQTLDGALVTLGPDQGRYTDVSQTVVYWSKGGNTTFSHESLPDPVKYHYYSPGLIVCIL